MVYSHMLIQALCITLLPLVVGSPLMVNGTTLLLPEQPNLTLYIDGKVDGKQEPNAVPDTPRNKFFIGGCDLDGAGY